MCLTLYPFEGERVVCQPFSESLKSPVTDVTKVFLEDADQRLVVRNELEVRAALKKVAALFNGPYSSKAFLLDGGIISFGRVEGTGTSLDEAKLAL